MWLMCSFFLRITIAGTVSTEMVSVYFCDYGDLAMVATKALRPIPLGVPLARSLPPQAIKARLYGKNFINQIFNRVDDSIINKY